MFSVSYSQGDVWRGLTPSHSDEHSWCETVAPVPQGVGRVLALRMDPPFKMVLATGSWSQDEVGVHMPSRHHTMCRDAVPPTAIWSVRSAPAVAGGGRVGSTPAPSPILQADCRQLDKEFTCPRMLSSRCPQSLGHRSIPPVRLAAALDSKQSAQ